jgi:hypothetical protein
MPPPFLFNSIFGVKIQDPDRLSDTAYDTRCFCGIGYCYLRPVARGQQKQKAGQSKERQNEASVRRVHSDCDGGVLRFDHNGLKKPVRHNNGYTAVDFNFAGTWHTFR